MIATAKRFDNLARYRHNKGVEIVTLRRYNKRTRIAGVVPKGRAVTGLYATLAIRVFLCLSDGLEYSVRNATGKQ